MFPSWAMVLKLPKIVHSLQFCPDLSKRSQSVKAILVYTSERSHYALLEHSVVYRCLRQFANNYCNRFRFVADISKILSKRFSDNWRKEIGTRSSFFIYCLSSKWNSFLYLKIIKFIFMCYSLQFILVCKLPRFWTKASDLDDPSCFSKTLKILKIHYVLSPREAEETINLMDFFFCVVVVTSWSDH